MTTLRESHPSPEDPGKKTTRGTSAVLDIRDLSLGYGKTKIIDNLNLTFLRGEFVALLGPNGCGKSTILKSLARIIAPIKGEIILDGQPIEALRARELARKISYLPQHPLVPESMRVRDLVARGRYPHHTLWKRWTVADTRSVDKALEKANVTHLADAYVGQLSGGQRQRAWIALVLAQDTDVVLLDEPTSFLDIAYQLEVLELARDLAEFGKTVITVLHDMNQAARYASRLIVVSDGTLRADGSPAEVIHPKLVEEIFAVKTAIDADPVTGAPRLSFYDPTPRA